VQARHTVADFSSEEARICVSSPCSIRIPTDTAQAKRQQDDVATEMNTQVCKLSVDSSTKIGDSRRKKEEVDCELAAREDEIFKANCSEIST
jgi:hypothetical protein